MALIKHHKVVASLPAQLEANALYYVRAAEGFDLYVTNASGQIVAYPTNKPKTDLTVTRDSQSMTIRSSTRSDPSGDAYLPVANGAANLAGIMSAADQSKLAGVQAEATKNATDAQLRDRATHTGMMPASAVDGLGSAAFLTAAVGTADLTRGRAQTIGNLGYGSPIVSTEPNANLYVTEGLYLSPGTGLVNFPEGFTSRVFLQVIERSNYIVQIVYAAANGQMAYRTGTNTGSGITTAWNILWSGSNLKLQSSTTDNTPNTVLTQLGAIGPFGVGGYPIPRRSLDQINSDRGNEFFDSNLATSENPFGNAGAGVHIKYPAANRWGEIFFKLVGPSTVSLFARAALGAAPLAPVEIIHSGSLNNLPNITVNSTEGSGITASSSQPAPLRVMRPGSSGNVAIRFTSAAYDRYLGFATGGVLKIADDADLGGSVSARTVWTSNDFSPAGTPVVNTSATAVTVAASAWSAGAPYYRFRAAAATTFTVPANSSAAIPIGAEITLRRIGAANLTIVESSGVVVNRPALGSLVMSQGMSATLKKVDTNEWDLIGQTVAA